MVNKLKKHKVWLAKVNSQARLNSIQNLATVYQNFFLDTHAVGFSKFKSHKRRKSFQCPQYFPVDIRKRDTITIPKAPDIIISRILILQN